MKTLFLGSGYVGNSFRRLYPYSIHTSRSREKLLHQDRGIIFDCNNPVTWNNAATVKPDGIIVSFPLEECTNPEELANFLFSLTEKILVIGTTSSFSEGQEIISDESSVDMTKSRSKAEEIFRKKGAVILHSAGIYGEGRNPLDWVRKGLITNGDKTVNLVHVEDLARACNFLLEDFRPSERYVISDCHPYRWKDIISFAVDKKLLAQVSMPEIPVRARIIKPLRLQEEGFVFKHPALFEELRKLEHPEDA